LNYLVAGKLCRNLGSFTVCPFLSAWVKLAGNGTFFKLERAGRSKKKARKEKQKKGLEIVRVK
jgi:hypothetical protein